MRSSGLRPGIRPRSPWLPRFHPPQTALLSQQLSLVSLARFPMNLVMFDIDGTLTETMKIDEECFVRSLQDVFGFDDIDTDWSHYPRTTDSGIFHDVFTSRIGRPPMAQEVSRFRQHFIQLLTAASAESP